MKAYLLSVALLLFLVSCEKSDTAPEPVQRLKSIQMELLPPAEDVGFRTAYFSYDAIGRVSNIEFKFKSTLTVPDTLDKVITFIYTGDNKLPTSAEVLNYYGDEAYNHIYTYDNQSRLIKDSISVLLDTKPRHLIRDVVHQNNYWLTYHSKYGTGVPRRLVDSTVYANENISLFQRLYFFGSNGVPDIILYTINYDTNPNPFHTLNIASIYQTLESTSTLPIFSGSISASKNNILQYKWRQTTLGFSGVNCIISYVYNEKNLPVSSSCECNNKAPTKNIYSYLEN